MKSDSMSTLIALGKLKGKSHPVVTIMRELALDMGASAYVPTTCEHIPGLSNKLVDALSRQFEIPCATFPHELTTCTRRFLESQVDKWWLAA